MSGANPHETPRMQDAAWRRGGEALRLETHRRVTEKVGWPGPEPQGTTPGGRALGPVLALAAVPVAEPPEQP